MKNVLLTLIIILFAANAFAQDCQNDTIPPNANCVYGIAIQIGTTIFAEELDAGSSDNCSSRQFLGYSFSPDQSNLRRTFSDSIGRVFVNM